jgi:hypothetical protein
MPVKWIAIESLADRVYTSKSDVVCMQLWFRLQRWGHFEKNDLRVWDVYWQKSTCLACTRPWVQSSTAQKNRKEKMREMKEVGKEGGRRRLRCCYQTFYSLINWGLGVCSDLSLFLARQNSRF